MFYTFLSYLEKWDHFDDLKVLWWIQLINYPIWDDVQQNILFLIEKNKNNINQKSDEDGLFDEFDHVVNIFKIRVHKWQKNSTNVEEKQRGIFEYMVNQNIGNKTYQELLNMLWQNQKQMRHLKEFFLT